MIAELSKKARTALKDLSGESSRKKTKALELMASSLLEEADRILEANAVDLETARNRGRSGAFLKRLELNHKKINAMSEALRSIAAQEDPVGVILETRTRHDGLTIKKVSVPFGVVAIIYESRPNVTSDAAGLCLRSSNAVILRGGLESHGSNLAITHSLRQGLAASELNPDLIQYVSDVSHSAVDEILQARGLVDLVIPRGGKELISKVVSSSKVPVIETGLGNCHVYVDKAADLEKAVRIIVNAKTSNPAVCNAAETLLVHQEIAGKFLPRAVQELENLGVEIRGCEKTRAICPNVAPASEEDWETEYLDLVLAVRIVPSLEDALEHIERYGTMHSEAIVTEDPEAAYQFTQQVDAAAVYVNASTRFTDGGEFGLGAEIGVSTQKLHARGPMGARELTTYKYVVAGNGHARE